MPEISERLFVGREADAPPEDRRRLVWADTVEKLPLALVLRL
jgi:hypothetical protein